MPAHRFKLEIAGTTMHGLAFGSECELDEFMAGRGMEAAPTPAPAAQIVVSDEPRAPGRPSYDGLLETAAKTLDLSGCKNISDRARRVLKHLAQTHSAEEIPSMTKAREFFAANPVARNPARKYARNSKRERLLRTRRK